MSEKLDVEETQKFVDAEIPILVFIEKGKKVYYKLVKVIDDKLLKQGLMYRFVPLTNAEMKAQGIEESTAQEVNDASPIDIEESAAQAVEPESNLTLKGTPEAVAAAKKILMDKQAELKKQAQQPDEKDEIIEDLTNKLGIIAEKQFEKKRKEVGAPDSVNTPEKLQGFITAKEALDKNEHGGVAPLNYFQYNGGQQQATDLAHRKFSNINEAIATLQAERRSGNKEAADLLDKLWQKGIHDWRVAGHPAQTFSIDDNVEKVSGTPDINFDNVKPQEDMSEIARFGVKKAEFNYSKTHNAAGQPKNGGN